MIEVRFADIFARLAELFPDEQVRSREQAGQTLRYIKAPTAQNRLDDVLGPAGWWDSYQILDECSVECSLTIRLPDGSTLTKRDVGNRMPPTPGKLDAKSSWKAGSSDALKRAASKFGVARHLARCGTPEFVEPTLRRLGRIADSAPAPAAPPTPPAPAPAQQGGRDPEPARRPAGDGGPRTGRALFAWCKEREQEHQVALLKYLTGWAKLQEFPGRMVDWGDAQVAQGFAEASRKLDQLGFSQEPERGDAYEAA